MLKITAYSSAMFSTWVFVENHGLLFDAGDGVSAGLLQKARKIKTIAVTHADRDHLAGLLQLLQLNGREGLPKVLYPEGCGSFPALAEFTARFDPHTSGQASWQPVKAGERIPIDKDLELLVVPRTHIEPVDGKIKSVGYVLLRKGRKLKPEFVGLPQGKIRELAQTRGQELMQPTETPLLGFSGDGPAEVREAWRGCEVLLHEATFLAHDDAENHSHSVLEDVLKMAAAVNPGRLVLYHFSTRFELEEIRKVLEAALTANPLPFPVSIIPPGEIVRDVLNSNLVVD